VCAKPPNGNVTNEGNHAMSSKSRHRRIPDQRRRGLGATGAGVAIAVGGAMAAAFVSMGTASADTGDDAVTALAQAVDTTALAAAAVPAPAAAEDAVTQLTQTTDPSAATVDAVAAQATLDAWEQLVLDIDPNAFNSAGDPTDFLGTIASQIDTDLASTVFGPELNTLATQAICADNPTCEPTLVITPPTTGDDGFTVLEQFLTQTYFPTALPLEFAPGLDSDLATIAGDLDSYFAPTAFGPEIYTIAEQIISGLTSAAG
jgi:hypothetical protein